jgi:hypothetical protein
MRLELFPFRFRDPLTGKWVRARYVAERHVIAERYAEYENIGDRGSPILLKAKASCRLRV